MARLEWSLVAQSYAIDRVSNALSVFNIIEYLSVPKELPELPAGQQIAVGPQFSIVQRWERTKPDASEYLTGRVQVLGPGDGVIGSGEFVIDLAAEKRARSIINFPFLPFAGVGDYKFITELKVGDEWQQMDKIVLAVTRTAN
jgi:hypothetical protein